jgi:hypothetical protein
VIKSQITKELSNIPGWRTNRKIVVFESDDWGSIRMSSKEALEALLKKGLPVKQCHYNSFDALESDTDVSALFDVLSSQKNSLGRTPIFTNVAIVGNPDFDKIREDHFQKYHVESFTKTLERYPCHSQVEGLIHNGILEKLIYPIFHGREHLNVTRWMNYLKEGNRSFQLAFSQGVTGISRGFENEKLKDVQAAFDLDNIQEIHYLRTVIKEGLAMFEDFYQFKAKYFVPTNGPFNNQLESALFDGGVKYINTAKKQLEPMGEGIYKKNYRYIGKKNALGQIYITRNCFFEPSSFENRNWVDSCLNEIEIAFRWKKPAVISTHRVNYIGFIDEKNRSKGLTQLKSLIQRILQKYPDVEFMTSVELGDLIANGKKFD